MLFGVLSNIVVIACNYYCEIEYDKVLLKGGSSYWGTYNGASSECYQTMESPPVCQTPKERISKAAWEVEKQNPDPESYFIEIISLSVIGSFLRCGYGNRDCKARDRCFVMGTTANVTKICSNLSCTNQIGFLLLVGYKDYFAPIPRARLVWGSYSNLIP